MIGPLNIHETANLVLPPEQLSDLSMYTNKHKMKINFKKTKILPFNFSRKYDFLPQIQFPECEPLEVIYHTKLLGVTISSDLSWSLHTTDITKRATKKLWVLVRFKSLGGTQEQLLTTYTTRIRSTLEFAAPVFHSGLTQEQSRQIEMVQKKALAIILGNQYTSYGSALTSLNLERLDNRRTELAYNFALKCAQSNRHRWMFPLNLKSRPNLRMSRQYVEPQCKTARYHNSPIPYLTRLLNSRSKEAVEVRRM